MITFKQFLKEQNNPPITQAQLNTLENILDKVFKKFGLDIEFTRHFLDRVNDERNNRQITFNELVSIYEEIYKKYAKIIAQKGKDYQAVINDITSNINIPFVLAWNPRTQMIELVNKTIMRKKDFKTSNQKIMVKTKG